MIWAYGASPTFARHAEAGSLQIDFSTGETRSILDTLHVVHGCLMVLAMGILLPAGVLVARFTKEKEPKTGPWAFWFWYHQLLQYGGVACMLSGFAVAVYFQQRDGNPHFTGPHCVLGLLVVILAVTQPLNAWIRPAKTAAWRWGWEYWHKGTGWAVLVASTAAIILGLGRINAASYFVLLYAILPAAFIVTFLVCEYRRRARAAGYTLMLNHDEESERGGGSPRGSSL